MDIQEKIDLSEPTPFYPELFKILQIKRHPYKGILEDRQISQIEKVYKAYHDIHQTAMFFQIVRRIGDIKTQELVMDTIFNWEKTEVHKSSSDRLVLFLLTPPTQDGIPALNYKIEHDIISSHHSNSSIPPLQFIYSDSESKMMESMFKIKDLKLRSWVLNYVDRGFVYQTKKVFNCMIIYLKLRRIKPYMTALWKFIIELVGIVFFYLDLLKDFLAYNILNNLASKVLVSGFEDVGGINFHITKWYFMLSSIISQVMLILNVQLK